jgi:hypothetical protein
MDADLPISLVDNPFFLRLLLRLDREFVNKALRRRTVMRDELSALYQRHRAALQLEFQTAASMIHLSFDLWTSPNQKAVMAIVSHFLNQDLKTQARLLAIKHHEGDHSGINLASSLATVIRDWDIESRIGALISDNVTNNDIYVATFYR